MPGEGVWCPCGLETVCGEGWTLESKTCGVQLHRLTGGVRAVRSVISLISHAPLRFAPCIPRCFTRARRKSRLKAQSTDSGPSSHCRWSATSGTACCFTLLEAVSYQMRTQSIIFAGFYSIDSINLNYFEQGHGSRTGKLSNLLLEDETATRLEEAAFRTLCCSFIYSWILFSSNKK